MVLACWATDFIWDVRKSFLLQREYVGNMFFPSLLEIAGDDHKTGPRSTRIGCRDDGITKSMHGICSCLVFGLKSWIRSGAMVMHHTTSLSVAICRHQGETPLRLAKENDWDVDLWQ